MANGKVVCGVVLGLMVIGGIIAAVVILNGDDEGGDDPAPPLTPQQCALINGTIRADTCFVGSDEAVTWEEGETRCIELGEQQGSGGHLVAVVSADLNDIVVELGLPTTPTDTAEVWTGLNDRGTEGDFFFSDGEDLASTGYDNWLAGEPASTTSTHDCAVVADSTNSTLRGGWRMLACENLRPYLCEFGLASAPGAPTDVAAANGARGASLDVSFVAPEDNGGLAITSYRATATPTPAGGGNPEVSETGTSSPITITGLVAGQAYNVSVVAINAVGDGAAGLGAASITAMATAPDAPSSVMSFAGLLEVHVTWEQLFDGDSPITGFTVSATAASGADPADITVGPGVTEATFTGLTAGVAYTPCVEATNAVGSASACAPARTPADDVPGRVTDVMATAQQEGASVSFTAPMTGAVVTDFVVTASPGGEQVTGPASPLVFTLGTLEVGVTYTFSVVANSAVGPSAPSDRSNAVVPFASVPSAPTIGAATAVEGAVSVAFTESADDGGSPVLMYHATSTPGGITGSGTASPIVVTGLSVDVAYTFTVTAENLAGMSPASAASNAAMPIATVPDAPTDVVAVAGNEAAHVSFTSPANTGGRPLLALIVVAEPSPAGGNFSATVTDMGAGGIDYNVTYPGLAVNTTYTFSVVANNAEGDSAASVQSGEVIPFALAPAVPVISNTIVGPQEVIITLAGDADDRGCQVEFYTVVGTPAVLGEGEQFVQIFAARTTAAATPFNLTVENLDATNAYRYEVTATNCIGEGDATPETAAVTALVSVPDPPTDVVIQSLDKAVSVSFTPPANDGGSPIVSYTVSLEPGAVSRTVTVEDLAGENVIGIASLENGVAYTVTLTAQNAVGSSTNAALGLDPVSPKATGGKGSNTTAVAVGASVSVAVVIAIVVFCMWWTRKGCFSAMAGGGAAGGKAGKAGKEDNWAETNVVVDEEV